MKKGPDPWQSVIENSKGKPHPAQNKKITECVRQSIVVVSGCGGGFESVLFGFLVWLIVVEQSWKISMPVRCPSPYARKSLTSVRTRPVSCRNDSTNKVLYSVRVCVRNEHHHQRGREEPQSSLFPPRRPQSWIHKHRYGVSSGRQAVVFRRFPLHVDPTFAFTRSCQGSGMLESCS